MIALLYQVETNIKVQILFVSPPPMGWCCSPNWSSSGNYRCKRACLDVGGIFRSTPYVIKRPVKWLSTDRFPHVRLCLGLGWHCVSVNSNACVTRSDKISLATHTWVEQIVISRAGQKLTVSHFPARNAIGQVFWILGFLVPIWSNV